MARMAQIWGQWRVLHFATKGKAIRNNTRLPKNVNLFGSSYLFISLLATQSILSMLRHIVQGHQGGGILQNHVIFINPSIRAWHLYLVRGVLVASLWYPTSVCFIRLKISSTLNSYVCLLNFIVGEAIFWNQYEELFLDNIVPEIRLPDIYQQVLEAPSSSSRNSSSKLDHRPHFCFLSRWSAILPR